ncbi:hypothetical protein B0H19DRAFT_1201147 [Mycena capillaripes]|nr:hypothetical protein B0H19DRAFT_1201147 [Mycena capillaripes]
MTLVIRADDTIFRVSKSVLCVRSSVFRDMVAFPNRTWLQGPWRVALWSACMTAQPMLRCSCARFLIQANLCPRRSPSTSTWYLVYCALLTGTTSSISTVGHSATSGPNIQPVLPI